MITDNKTFNLFRSLSRRSNASYRRLNVKEEKNGKESDRFPKGYVPVMVGKEKGSAAKFLVHISMFKNASFIALLETAADEVGYENNGILRIPCDAETFRNMVDVISRGN